MSTVQLTTVTPGYSDPRKLPGANAVNDSGTGTLEDFETHIVDNDLVFAANAAGTTTTIVGADGVLATSVNVVRLGEKFVLVDANGDLKEATVFTIDTLASATGTTTVTFSPAAAVATVGTDEAHLVGISKQDSVADLDQRLLDLGFSQTVVDQMTLNDKQYQVRVSDDPGSL